MADDGYYLRLRRQVEGLWPVSVFPLPDLAVLDRIWIRITEVTENDDRLLFESALIFEDTLELGLPSLDALTVSLGDPASGTEIGIIVDLFPHFAASIGPLDLNVNVRSDLLRPVEPIPGGSSTSPRFEIIQGARLSITVAEVVASFDLTGNITIESDYSVSLPPTMIGSTGIVVEADDLRLVMSDRDAAALSGTVPADARGLFIDGATVYLPEGISVAVPSDITIENCIIGPAGFSGEFEGTWSPVVSADKKHFDGPGAGDVFSVPFALDSLSLQFVDNVPVEARLSGRIILPYFDETVEVAIEIDVDGNFIVSIRATDESGIVVTREELLELTLRSLAIGTTDNRIGVTVSGGLRPLLMGSDGLEWPQLDVTDLSIDSTGKFTIKEAWLDLKELATLDLWGFHFELRRIGIGTQKRDDADGDRLWLDLSGGLRLIEQIPVALDVEGFRLTWPQNLLAGVTGPPSLTDIQAAASKIEVEFAGIYLFFGVPDAVEFEGLIRFFKDAQIVGFAGDMALRVPASGFGAEAGLLIGLSFVPPFPFLYVYFGVDLPAGIPLGQSGLALKGAQGMFGLNVAPDKTPEQNWYYDWYKRGPIVGAHPTNKWKPLNNALALGVGVTITTADGYVKGTRGLIVLAIPGPILIIEGRALILSGLQSNAEPPLRALAVFDGGAGTVQFNIEAEATLIADLLKAYGMLEAFFDFNDLTNWHIYLGQDTPRDRRIRADILRLENSLLFKADAYLMMDMVGADSLRSRIGVSIGFEPKVPKIDPLEVDFAATLAGDGLLTARPEQFSGEVDLSAHIRLSALGVSVRLSADASFLTEGPQPLKVGAHVNVKAEMPAPLDPFETTLEFEWEAPGVPKVESPLSEIAVSSRFIPDGGGFREDASKLENRIRTFDSINGHWEVSAKQSPVVPVDSQPIIGFKQKMNSTIESFARHPDGNSRHYDVGLFHFEPSLTTIKLYEHPKLSNDEWFEDERDWALIGSTDPDDQKPLPGVWLVESEPESPDAPSPRRLQFWTDNPLSSSARALGAGYTQFRGAIRPGKPLAARLLDDYPALMQCIHTKVESVCVDFKAAGDVVIDPGDSWEYEDLRFEATFRTATVRVEGNGTSNTISGPTTGLGTGIADALRRSTSWLVDSLLNRAAADTCLFVDGYIDIHFRPRVKKVRIVLCQPSKISAAEIRVRVSARRGSRSVDELKASSGNGHKGITLADLRACNVNVPADLTVSAQEWLLEADEGFDCLHIVRMDEFAIREICYTTVEEVERSRRGTQECKNNSNLPHDGQTLRPGAYYRLDVTTTITGKLHLEDLPFSQNSAIGEMLVAAYNAFVAELTGGGDQLNKEFHQTCFFQTEAPPTNLRPYVKWGSPEHQSEQFFYGDNIAIRFLRSGLQQMFGAPFDLTIQIRDTQGKLVDGYQTNWQSAKSATLFPEESTWEAHRSTLGWPAHAIPNDDVLIAELIPGSQDGKLLPQSRYQIEVVSAGLPDRQPSLFSSTFVTSRFDSFGSLAESYSGSAKSIRAKAQYQSALSSVAEIQQSARVLARARWDWEHADVDYRFESLRGGRKGLEQARLARREAAANHDAKFRALAESLADLYFHPVSDCLELYLIRDPRANFVVGAWIRSPESLDLRSEVFANPGDQQSERIDYVGRTEISLRSQSTPSSVSPIIALQTTDSTQLLIFPGLGRRWRSGTYAFVLTYHRDYGDEAGALDHRYDRPIEYRRESIDAEHRRLEWSW